MKFIHALWAVLVVVFLTITVINAAISFMQKKEFTHKAFRLGLLTLILTHTQMLFGFIQYFKEKFFLGFSNMKDAPVRLLALEHPLMMLLAIVSITIGWSKHKKQVKSEAKFKTFLIFYGIALVLILSRIPWGNWNNTFLS